MLHCLKHKLNCYGLAMLLDFNRHFASRQTHNLLFVTQWCLHIALLCMRTVYWIVTCFEVTNKCRSSISIITYDIHITLGSILVNIQIRIFAWLRYPKPYTWLDHMHNIRYYNVRTSSLFSYSPKPTCYISSTDGQLRTL